MADEESKAAEESSFLQPSAVSGSEHEVEPAVSPYEDVREGDAEGTIGEDEEEVSSESEICVFVGSGYLFFLLELYQTNYVFYVML